MFQIECLLSELYDNTANTSERSVQLYQLLEHVLFRYQKALVISAVLKECAVEYEREHKFCARNWTDRNSVRHVQIWFKLGQHSEEDVWQKKIPVNKIYGTYMQTKQTLITAFSQLNAFVKLPGVASTYIKKHASSTKLTWILQKHWIIKTKRTKKLYML